MKFKLRSSVDTELTAELYLQDEGQSIVLVAKVGTVNRNVVRIIKSNGEFKVYHSNMDALELSWGVN